MAKNTNRSGSDASKRNKVLEAKTKKETKDRGGKNIGADKQEHSRLAKGNKTQQGPQKKRW